MVQINRSNMPRRVYRYRGGSSHPLVAKLQSFADSVPALARLSPADRLLALVGASLLGVVSFSYFFLISGIFSSSGLVGGSSDPRLSTALRKTGLSEEALLKRGGGRRIHVGPKQLDANENAVALDIISTLNCDALQEELEREWHTVLDEKRQAAMDAAQWENSWKDGNKWGDNAGEGDGVGFGGGDYQGGKMDDFAGEFAAERQAGGDQNGVGGDGLMMDDGMMINEGDGNNFRRRLLEDSIFDDTDRTRYEGGRGADDWNVGMGGGYSSYSSDPKLKLTARHLFCLAAEALALPKSTKQDVPDPAGTHCDINSFETREQLLGLWSSARSQMPEDVIQKTLRLVTEHKEDMRGHEVHIWYPDNDRGTEGMLRVLNSGYNGAQTYNFDSEPAETGHDDLYRFHDLPSKFVGPNKLFVDVGSALGLTSMLIQYLYPETTVVSIEPASPSWLIQNINYRCNLSHHQLQYVHPILAGVGTKHHDDNDSMMKMIWRPSMTSGTRSWNPEQEFDFAVDIELVVHLRTLRAILAEATPEDLPLGTPISVLNLDCEGCEYNLIPSMHETSFNSIGVILGRTNWGYIPVIKKPSSHRARETHQRVCTHYNFAKRCKECCDFPSLGVKPRLHDNGSTSALADEFEGGGGGGSNDAEKTVAEVAGDMCNGFEEWAKESKLRDIPDDYGWDEMSAFAAGR